MKDTTPTQADIGMIAQWMAEAGVDGFELTGNGRERLLISLSPRQDDDHVPGHRPPATMPEMPVITAPYFGFLSLASHLADASCIDLRQGEVIGHLELVYLTVPITAPCDGRIIEWLAEPGSLIGYGAPVLRMLPASAG